MAPTSKRAADLHRCRCSLIDLSAAEFALHLLASQFVNTGTDPRIETLEFKCAFLERSIQELSDVLARQQQELEQARARIEDLARQLAALDAAMDGTGGPPDPRAEVPPHY